MNETRERLREILEKYFSSEDVSEILSTIEKELKDKFVFKYDHDKMESYWEKERAALERKMASLRERMDDKMERIDDKMERIIDELASLKTLRKEFRIWLMVLSVFIGLLLYILNNYFVSLMHVLDKYPPR